MLIHEFHSKFGSRNDQGLLFDALRRLRLAKDLKSMAVEGTGWILWTDTVQDPDGGGSLRLAPAAA